MPPTITAPTLLTDPGTLLWAPLGSTEPSHTAAGSVFTDAWAVAWLPFGATEEGGTFSTQTTVEAVRAAEFYYALKWATTEKASSLAFAAQDFTLTNFKRLNNGGALSTLTGTGATLSTKYSEPAPGSETRCMLGWESLDHTVRLIARQCFNSAAIAPQFGKAPAKALLAAEFQFEQPSAGEAWNLYAAGTARLGV